MYEYAPKHRAHPYIRLITPNSSNNNCNSMKAAKRLIKPQE